MYKLSFCIPQYNNADAAYRLVIQLLENKNQQFQVVISDDASTDDTIKRLQTIKDSRLKVCVNRNNVGAKLNWCNALDQGDGKWLYLVMGRDQLNAQKIDQLIELLDNIENKNVGCVADRYVEDRVKILHQFDGIDYFIKAGEHPTGTIFNRKAFREISDRKKYFMLAFAYPEIYIKRDILCKYSGAIINSKVFTGKVNINKRKVKSCFEKNKDILYYYPQKRVEQFIHVINMVELEHKFQLCEEDYEKFFCHRWDELMHMVTINWKKCNEDSEWVEHYNKEKRQVGKCEMMLNILASYKAVNRFYKDKNILVGKRKRGMMCIMIKMIKDIYFKA